MSISLRGRIFCSVLMGILSFIPFFIWSSIFAENPLSSSIIFSICFAIGIFISTAETFILSYKSNVRIIFYKVLLIILLGLSIAFIKGGLMHISTYPDTICTMCFPFALGLFHVRTIRRN